MSTHLYTMFWLLHTKRGKEFGCMKLQPALCCNKVLSLIWWSSRRFQTNLNRQFVIRFNKLNRTLMVASWSVYSRINQNICYMCNHFEHTTSLPTKKERIVIKFQQILNWIRIKFCLSFLNYGIKTFLHGHGVREKWINIKYLQKIINIGNEQRNMCTTIYHRPFGLAF